MATDIEESDRISPKKQRKLLSQTNDCHDTSNSNSTEDYKSAGPSGSSQEDPEEEKRRKLREWQAWQVRKAAEDNSLNDMFIPVNPANNPFFEILRELDMENQAVSMAIQNHGLVCSNNFSEPQTFRDNFLRDCCTIERRINSLKNDNIHSLTKSKVDENVIKDKIFEQQDFLLEQAVIEAIKKKGLSALTVDYG